MALRSEWVVAIGLGVLLSPLVFHRSGSATSSADGHDDSAGHRSAHGGVVAPIGRNHVEAVTDTKGNLRVYILGQDETELHPIPVRTLEAEVRATGEAVVRPVALKATREPGDPEGEASTFVASLPPALQGKPADLTVTVPVGRKRYRARLELLASGAGHTEATPMPPAPVDAAEQKLFLSPGGLYTEQDIVANQRATPSVRFAGFQASHDMNPRSGDRLCPVTLTKPHPTCGWIVNGKQYLFCCPPCVSEFVGWAKEKPEKIRAPEEYVKR